MMENMAQEIFGLVIREKKKKSEEMLSAATIFLQKRYDKCEEQEVRINREKHL